MAPAIIIALCVCSFNLSSCDSQHFGLNNHEIWLSRRWLKLAHFTFQLVKAKAKHKTRHCGSAGKGGGAWGFSGQCALCPHLLKMDESSWLDEWAAFGAFWSSLLCCCIPAAPGAQDFSPHQLWWRASSRTSLSSTLLACNICCCKTHSPYENAIKANQRGSFVPQHSICLYCFSGSLELQECPAVPSIIFVLRRWSTFMLVSFPFNFLYHFNQNCVL